MIKIKRHLSESTRAKISAAHLGLKVSPEARANMSKAATGHVTSPETRAKISATEKGKSVSLETGAKISAGQTGRILTTETREKISVANMGRVKSSETRARLSVAGMGNTNSLGHHYSEEAKRNHFLSQGRGCLSPNWKGGSKLSSRRNTFTHRLMGFIPLNSPLVGCEAHHIDNERVINMPRMLHKSVWHCQRTGKGMAQINAIAYNFLFKQEIEAAIAAKEEAEYAIN